MRAIIQPSKETGKIELRTEHPHTQLSRFLVYEVPREQRVYDSRLKAWIISSIARERVLEFLKAIDAEVIEKEAEPRRIETPPLGKPEETRVERPSRPII